MHDRIGRNLSTACHHIMAGGVIGYPTEGVFGLGCDPTNEDAIDALLTIKNRDIAKGFILIAANRQQLSPFIDSLSSDIEQKLSLTWPGPVTWILPCNAAAPAAITGNKPTIATRVTSHKVASDLCNQCDSAIISTSANISGEPACTTAQQVDDVFGTQLSYILDYEIGNLKGPTPIFDGLTGNQLR